MLYPRPPPPPPLLRLPFFFPPPATTELYTLSLHDALPISATRGRHRLQRVSSRYHRAAPERDRADPARRHRRLLGRCDREQDVGGRHHLLEPGRRTDVRLDRRRGGGPPHHAHHPPRAARGRGRGG